TRSPWSAAPRTPGPSTSPSSAGSSGCSGRMRTLVVSSYPPRHCGIGAYARDQVAELRGRGEEVVVLSPPDGDGDVRAPFLGGAAFRKAARVGRRFDRIVVHFQPALY